MTIGLHGLSLRRIAETTGCTTTQVYSKDGLLPALFDEGFEVLAAAQRAIPMSAPAEERAQHLCRAYLRIAAEYRQHYALMLGGHSADFTPPKESQELAMATLNHLVEAVAIALPSGHDQAEHASEVAHQILAFCHG
jgi:AcrR family transcriptional regulator